MAGRPHGMFGVNNTQITSDLNLDKRKYMTAQLIPREGEYRGPQREPKEIIQEIVEDLFWRFLPALDVCAVLGISEADAEAIKKKWQEDRARHEN